MHYSSNQLSVAAIAFASASASAAAKFININSKQCARFRMCPCLFSDMLLIRISRFSSPPRHHLGLFVSAFNNQFCISTFCNKNFTVN
jgi:hypothetical protein